MKISTLGFVAMLVMPVMSSHGFAATLNCSTSGNGNSGATFLLSNALQAACISGDNDAGAGGYFDGNPTLFGLSGWTLADKNDGGGNGKILFSDEPDNGAHSGDWGILSFAGYKDVLITLKAGKGFGAFLLDTTALTGLWSSSKDLSHASIWYTGKPVVEPPAPVPLPAAGFLLMGALAAMGLVRRRNRA